MLTVTLLDLILAADTPPYKFISKEEDDRVTATVEKTRTIFDIKCPRGISNEVIERTSEAWPEMVLVRLQLADPEISPTEPNGRSANASPTIPAVLKVGVEGPGREQDRSSTLRLRCEATSEWSLDQHDSLAG